MKKNRLLVNLPFLLLFVIMLIIFLNTSFMHDDMYFGSVLSEYKLVDFLKWRWDNWTSRLVLETFEVLFTSIHIYYLRIMNSLLFVLLAFSISRIFFKNNTLKNNSLACLSVLLVPIFLLHSAGWGSTSVVYLWPLSLGLFAFIPIANNIRDKETPIIYYIFSYLFLLVGLNNEQMCCLILGFSIITLIIQIMNKKKIGYNISIIIMAIISIIIITICPGNALRVVHETEVFYPEYANFSLKHKLYLGLIPSMNSLLINKVLISLLVSNITISVFKNNRSKTDKIIAVCTLLFTLLFTIFKPIFTSSFRYVDYIFGLFDYKGVPAIPITPSSLFLCIPIIITIVFVIVISYLLYSVFKDNNYYLLYPFMWLGAFASRFILGFSASVFASDERTAFFMFFIIILLNLLVIKNIKFKKEDLNYPLIITIMVAVINVISIIIENGLLSR